MTYENTIKRMIEQNEYIYMDTCCFMKYKQFYRFIETANKYLKLYKKKIIVIGKVHDELKYFTRSEYFDLKFYSTKALDYIYKNRDIFEIENNDSKDRFADKKFQLILLDNRSKHRQLLISNDLKLTKDVYNFNTIQSVRGFPIELCFIDNDGKLVECNHAKEYTILHQEIIIEKRTNLNKFIPALTFTIGTIITYTTPKLIKLIASKF